MDVIVPGAHAAQGNGRGYGDRRGNPPMPRGRGPAKVRPMTRLLTLTLLALAALAIARGADNTGAADDIKNLQFVQEC